jgi:hypothetical protein
MKRLKADRIEKNTIVFNFDAQVPESAQNKKGTTQHYNTCVNNISKHAQLQKLTRQPTLCWHWLPRVV